MWKFCWLALLAHSHDRDIVTVLDTQIKGLKLSNYFGKLDISTEKCKAIICSVLLCVSSSAFTVTCFEIKQKTEQEKDPFSNIIFYAN